MHSIINSLVGILFLGLLNVVLGCSTFYTLKTIKHSIKKDDSGNWNHCHLFELSLFISGMILWFISYGFAKFM